MTTATPLTSRQELNRILDKHSIDSINVSDTPGDGWELEFYQADGAYVALFDNDEDDYDALSQPLMDLLGDIALEGGSYEYTELSGTIKRVTLMGEPAFQFTGNVTQSFVTQSR